MGKSSSSKGSVPTEAVDALIEAASAATFAATRLSELTEHWYGTRVQDAARAAEQSAWRMLNAAKEARASMKEKV